MTPFQTYGQTAAPSNMVFPTAAYLQSSQNAAETRARGMEAMGKGIASGIGAAASGYMKYKETKSEVGASEKSYETLKSFLPPEVSSKIDSQIESMNQNPDMSLRDKAAFWKQTKSFLGDAVGQAFQMQKQQKELDARAALQAANEAAQNWRTLQQIDSAENEPFRRQAASMMTSGFGGTSKSSGYGGGKAPGNVSLYGDTPFTFGSHF